MRYITVCDWEAGMVSITTPVNNESDAEAAMRIGYCGRKTQEWISTETLHINV